MSIIASRSDRPESLKDAIEFAADWSNSTVDVTALYTRALIQRIYDAVKVTITIINSNKVEVIQDGSSSISLVEQQNNALETTISAAMEVIPRNFLRIIIYDTVTFLIEETQDLVESIRSSEKKSTHQVDSLMVAKVEVSQLTKGALLLCSFYLDSIRDAASNLLPSENDSYEQLKGILIRLRMEIRWVRKQEQQSYRRQ